MWLGDDATTRYLFTPDNHGNQADHNNLSKCYLQLYLGKLKKVCPYVSGH
jgi:hypothetical protein